MAYPTTHKDYSQIAEGLGINLDVKSQSGMAKEVDKSKAIKAVRAFLETIINKLPCF